MVYRIQFPCRYYKEDISFKLYICPELDILEMEWDVLSYFFEFATACYNQDRNRKGLLNVVLLGTQPFDLDLGFPIDKDAAKAAVYRIKGVILGGPVVSTISSDRPLREKPSSVPRLGGGITLNHLTTDPRAIDELVRLEVLGRHGLRESGKISWPRWRLTSRNAILTRVSCFFAVDHGVVCGKRGLFCLPLLVSG
jgi:hypothetical protein